MRFSNTMIEKWMRCPLQAKFRYIDHLPSKKTSRMTFGICVHAALEEYNIHGDVEKAISTFTDLWDNPEKVDAVPEIWPKGTSAGAFRDRGITLLTDYDDRLKFEDREVIAQEHRFLVPIGEHEIQGVVDLLEVRKSGRGKDVLRIVDYKTGSKAPYKDELRLNTQFTIYLYASMLPEFWLGNGDDYPPIAPNAEELWEKYKDTPRRGIYFHLLGSKEIDSGPREPEDFRRLYRAITEIARAVENQVYVPDISGKSCYFCDYTKECGVDVPTQAGEDGDDEFF